MKKTIQRILWFFSGLSAFILLGLILLILAAHYPSGRATIERGLFMVSAEKILISGLDGQFPAQLSIQHLELRDADSPWLTIDDLQLDWQPQQLLAGEIDISQLTAATINLQRLPTPTAPSTPSGSLSLPLTINLHSLFVKRLAIAPALAGEGADFAINGQLRLTANNHGQLQLHLQRLEHAGAYTLLANLTADELNAQLSIHEAAPSPLAKLAGLDNQKPLNIEASLAGPLSAIHSHLQLKLGGLQALLDGDFNWLQTGLDLKLQATAPAMTLRQDLAWQALALHLQLHGSLNRLNVNGGLQLDRLNVGQTAINQLQMTLQGTNGQITLDGQLAGLRLTATSADALQAKPLVFQANIDSDKPDFPCFFALKHPLIAASGQATHQANQSSTALALTLPNLQAVAAVAGLQMAGNAQLTLKHTQQDSKQQLQLTGNLELSGNTVWAKLLGKSAQFELAGNSQDQDITLSALHLTGKALSFAASGGLSSGHADFNWQAQLNELAAVIAGDSGSLSAQGRLTGAVDDFTLSSDLNGTLASKGYPSGPISANLAVQHLPSHPDGGLTLNGVLLQAPLNIHLKVNSPEDKQLQLFINKADWKSAHAQGSLLFKPDSPLPVGKVDLQINRLADLQPLIKQPLSGSINASLESGSHNGQPQAKLSLTAMNSGLAGTASIASSHGQLTINHAAGQPKVEGLFDLNGISSGTWHGSAQIKLDGGLDALSLQLSAALPQLSGSAAQINAAALLNVGNSSLRLNTLQADWRQQTLRLLAPANIAYQDGLSVDKLRLGLQQAELELGGRISPELALTAELHNTSAELLSLFAPNLALTGTLHADANLHGSLTQPSGQLRITADKLQMKNGAARGLPPAGFTANATLQGDSADLAMDFKAGDNISLQLAGQLPLSQQGLFALHGTAALNLKELDPILTVDGRRARGQLKANTQLTGSWSAPMLSGTGQLDQGQWQDFASGVGLRDISAALTAEDGQLRITNLQAHAGPGTLSASGSIGLLTPGMPIDITLSARNAKPLSSDQLTVNLDADVVLGGFATEQMTATGRIHINRADIRIPERMPTTIAVLKLSNSSQQPLLPATDDKMSLNLTLDAPEEIFIRGRGIDAELGGTVQVNGPLNRPHPDGDFKLRKGQYTLAGQDMIFNQGSVGFDNNSLTNPTLNFVAISTRNNVTATITITGNAQHPIITLTSSPTLPQDEVLANLLFGKGAANLSTLEMVQIAATLASLTGVDSGVGDPLDNLRQRLGLDRLSAGGVNPSLEAGRYLAPGVYLGAKQGIAGGAPQPIIQIDLTKHFKLEGGVGSGAAASSSTGSAVTNSLGIIYKIEY